jgi:hypothetical protein
MAGHLSLRFWGTGRLVLQQPGRWEVRSWPDWQLLEAGGGTAVAEPGGDRLAVVAPDDTIGVDGKSAALTLPPGAGRPTGLAWSGGSLVVAARASGSGRSDPAGVSARPFGAAPTERSSLWRLPLDGTPPTWLYDAPPGTRIWAVHDLAGGVLVELYPYGDSQPAAAPRLLVIAGEGQARDLAPERSGACCDAAVGPDGRVAFLHGDFPHSELVFPTWFALMEGTQGRWRTLLPPQRRWARPTWAGDGSRLLVTAAQGIRSGIVTVDPTTGHWQWCALEPAASYRSPAMAAAGGEVVALRQPLDGQPAIVAVRGRHQRVLQPLGEPAAGHCQWRVHTWQGSDGTLEGILGTPLTGGAPWPLVVDLHAGPQSSGLVSSAPGKLPIARSTRPPASPATKGSNHKAARPPLWPPPYKRCRLGGADGRRGSRMGQRRAVNHVALLVSDLAGRTSYDAAAGTGRSDHDPVNQLGDREVPACLVLQPSERDIVTWATKIQRDPVDPDEQLMPLGSGLHLHLDKADRAQRRGPVDAQAARQPGIVRGLRLPTGQHQPMTGPQDTEDLAARRRQIGGQVQGVDGDDRVGAGSRKPGRGQVADDEACLLGQPEQRHPVCCVLDGDGREVDPDQGGALRLRQPQARAAAATSHINQCLPGCEGQGVGDVAEQGDRDEGERLDLRGQVGVDGLPDPPDAGGDRDGGKALVEAGGRGQGSCLASNPGVLAVLRHRRSLLDLARG